MAAEPLTPDAEDAYSHLDLEEPLTGMRNCIELLSLLVRETNYPMCDGKAGLLLDHMLKDLETAEAVFTGLGKAARLKHILKEAKAEAAAEQIRSAS